MKKVLSIASAFIGVIIGAGFASGNEIVQYFTSLGMVGTFAIILSAFLFGYMGWILTKLGSRLKAQSHDDVIYKIGGKFLGRVIDYILIFVLFGVGVVMIAGGGSTLKQQFDLPFAVGAVAMAVLVFVACLGNVELVEKIIGAITPFLLIAVVGVSVYSLATMSASFSELEVIAKENTTPVISNWILSAFNYVSFNIAVGASMSIVMGGAEKNEKTAAMGGLVGGIGVGLIMILSHLAIFAKMDVVATVDMPMLALVNDISPILGTIYSFVLFAMVFNTALGMFFAFSVRFGKPGTKKFTIFTAATIVVGFILSFVGFTGLVAFFYPLFGYLGLVLMACLVVASFRMPKQNIESVSSEKTA